MTVSGWESIFQDMLRRSQTVKHVTVISSWMCTRMRSDGFGGMAMLITATDVMTRSTYSMIDEMIAITEQGSSAGESGTGSNLPQMIRMDNA